MKDVLLVFYSQSGFTRRVAEQIAKRLDCGICDIQEKHPRQGWTGWLRSGFDAMTGRTPALREHGYDPSRYAVVIVGTPVWVGKVASPVRAFLTHHPMGAARVAVFCTYGGSGADRALDALVALSGKAPLARLALTDAEIQGGAGARKVDAFVDAIRAEIRA